MTTTITKTIYRYKVYEPVLGNRVYEINSGSPMTFEEVRQHAVEDTIEWSDGETEQGIEVLEYRCEEGVEPVECKRIVRQRERLARYFEAYGINELLVNDVVGEGTDLTAYSSTDNWIELPVDCDDDSCIDEMDLDFINQEIYDLLVDKVGDYTEASVVITANDDGSWQVKGTASKSVCC